MSRVFPPIILFIDWLNEQIGRIVSWLVITMVFTVFTVAILRYGFSLGWVWLQESYVWMHGVVFMVVSGYTLLHDGHVRIDLIYGSRGPRYKAWTDILGFVFLLTPMLGVVAWTSLPYVLLSWERLESSGSSNGLPGVFLIKTAILLFVLLLWLQGVSVTLKSLLVLSGNESDDSQPRSEEG